MFGALVFAGSAHAHGQRIAFQSDSGPADAPFTQLYTMNADGSDIRSLLPDLPNSFDIAWSTSGHRFAFSTILDVGYFEVFVARRDGSHLRRITHDTDDVHDGSPVWFPFRNELAFVSDRTGAFELYRTWL